MQKQYLNISRKLKKKTDTMDIIEKIEKLEDFLENKKCILAYSGGSDSTLLAYILSKVSPESILVTIDNNLMPEEFIDYTVNSARKFNLEHIIIEIDFLEDERFLENNSKRCYNCRKLMYLKITELDIFNEYDYFLEGTNLTDLLEDRPGNPIRDMYNMTSPLVECQITKDDVFAILDYLKLDYCKNTTCLATRVKTNERISEEKLEKIDDIETFIKKFIKQDNIRIRTNEDVATIVVDNPIELIDKDSITEIRDYIISKGFNKVYLDLTSYSKNEFKISQEDNLNYYTLPYNIDLDSTFKKISETLEYDDVVIDNNKITYSNVSIYDDGRISILKDSDFKKMFFEVLPCIVRR